MTVTDCLTSACVAKKNIAIIKIMFIDVDKVKTTIDSHFHQINEKYILINLKKKIKFKLTKLTKIIYFYN